MLFVMEVIAHRGFCAEYPENSLKAFENAQQDCDIVEFDVQVTDDGVPIVVHSNDLSLISETDKKVSESSWDSIKNTTIFDSEETIPTLQETVNTLSDKRIIVDLKNSDELDKVYDTIQQHDCSVTVVAFNHELLKPTIDSDLKSAVYLSSDDKLRSIPEINSNKVPSSKQEALELADQMDCSAVHVEKSMVERSLVKDFQDEGYDVRVWTVRQDRSAWRLKEMNIQGIITDSYRFCRFV